MPQRTLAEAREALEMLTPQLNPEMYQRLSSEVNEVAQATHQRAVRYMDQTTNDSITVVKDTLAELCEVRDQLAALAAEGEAGRLTAAEYNKQHQVLTQRHRSISRRVEKLTRDAELLERIEDDPAGWADQRFHTPHPELRPHFSF